MKGALDRAEPPAPIGVVRGYASLFGRTDMAGDRIERGAFLASLARRGAAGVRMLWQHDPAQPIGRWTALREDANGLFVEGRLAMASGRAREVAALIAAKAVDGLSIGFRTRRARRSTGETKRVLTEIDLWEISVVTFPMQAEARLSGF
ncbi:HK97 family phage prohead protease [Consotaella salsifontis]|uniref:Prohead serine protease domain-containing protein n=1 Tax=Consotaella salsifontis TaxID=1365950 RepID=A0A1T4MEX1_9HYPH|nr:hypothetical protein SAMN05428963_10288 [Consotaella salsifontis]